MVRLNALFGFQDVRIDGALSEEFDSLELSGFFGEDVDEFLSDDLAFGLGIGYAGQFVEEAVHRIHVDQIGAKLFTEHLDDLFRFTFAQQTMVDVHAYELLSDGFDQQRRGNGRVNTAGQRQQHLFIADLRSQVLHLLFDKGLRQLRRRNAFHGIRTFISLLHTRSLRNKSICSALYTPAFCFARKIENKLTRFSP